MDINELAQKIPRPVLLLGILIGALIFFVYNDPLRDECEVQTQIFEKKMQGILTAYRTKTKKTQFAQIEYWKSRCREGNSIGSCNDYFEGLRLFTKELHEVNEHCQVKYSQSNERFVNHVTQAIQIMALVAWGEQPPIGMGGRQGWLNESNVKTFCYLKKTLLLIAGEEIYFSLREKVYREYPGEWPDKFDVNKLVEKNIDKSKPGNQEVDVASIVAENRLRAYKTPTNPSGTLKKEEIFERSLFSIRCDLYM